MITKRETYLRNDDRVYSFVARATSSPFTRYFFHKNKLKTYDSKYSKVRKNMCLAHTKALDAFNAAIARKIRTSSEYFEASKIKKEIKNIGKVSIMNFDVLTKKRLQQQK